MKARAFLALLFLVLLAARLCHLRILWAEEDLPLAAGVQLLHGKTLYRDVWFDKPPLVVWTGLLWGARTGWPLRVAGALYAFAACWLIYRFARDLWGEREARAAAALLAFFLVFGLPAAVAPLASDLLMLAPHIAAVWLAWRGRAFLSGILCGVALLISAKAVFVIAACLLWIRSARFAFGLALPVAAALAWMAARGSLADAYEQVWRYGRLYAGHTFVADPVREGILRTANWAGFHAALVLGAAWFWRRDRGPRARFAGWALLSLAAVAAGWRFFPRYYFQLLPVMALAGARGIVRMGRARAIALLLLLVPLARFGPRYVILAGDLAAGRPHQWRDIVMDQDSQAAAALIHGAAAPGDTLFVWGYRPDLYVYTRLPAASRFLESQPLTGVFADRHLFASGLADEALARAGRRELIRSRPSFVVDGLSPFNPKLAMENYEELRPWLRQYREIARTRYTIIRRLVGPH